MTIPIPLLALLLLIVASGLGALARWIAQRIGASDPIAFWIGLFVALLIATFGKIT